LPRVDGTLGLGRAPGRRFALGLCLLLRLSADIFAKAAATGAEDGFAGGPEAQQVYAGAIESFERAVSGQKFGAPTPSQR
jgi:hypothetical protein